MNPYLKALAEEPLSDAKRASKIWLPEGRRPAPRAPKPVYEGDFLGEKLTTKQLRERQIESYSEKLCAVFDYYAKTDVPFERIAAHTKLSEEQVADAMSRRGRLQ